MCEITEQPYLSKLNGDLLCYRSSSLYHISRFYSMILDVASGGNVEKIMKYYSQRLKIDAVQDFKPDYNLKFCDKEDTTNLDKEDTTNLDNLLKAIDSVSGNDENAICKLKAISASLFVSGKSTKDNDKCIIRVENDDKNTLDEIYTSENEDEKSVSIAVKEKNKDKLWIDTKIKELKEGKKIYDSLQKLECYILF